MPNWPLAAASLILFIIIGLMEHIDLDDGTADCYLLDARGSSLLVFYSKACGTCTVARASLPTMQVPADRLCWIDAGSNSGLVERYEVFYLPALFLVRDGVFYGAVNALLEPWDLRLQMRLALDSYPAELP